MNKIPKTSNTTYTQTRLLRRLEGLLLLWVSFLSGNRALANDGAFKARGNHLIPIVETDIAVRKEILTLKKVRNQYMEVTVYYEFYNPGLEKTITVGFEAMSPSGDVEVKPKNGLHPYMRDFTVDINGEISTHKVAYVSDSAYVANGIVKSRSLEEITKEINNPNEAGFYYVYYFEAKFKRGLNIIKHTYNYDLSGSVDYYYEFEYVLTAANRWANKQINDFTLMMDMGEFETFLVDTTFFKSEKDWLINGIGKAEKDSYMAYPGPTGAVKFHLQKGNLIFWKRNFKAGGELFVKSRVYTGRDSFNTLPFSYYQTDNIPLPNNALQKKILRNLPFARRGYVFKDKELQKYYESMDWYIPNPNYVPETRLLDEREIAWTEKWKS